MATSYRGIAAYLWMSRYRSAAILQCEYIRPSFYQPRLSILFAVASGFVVSTLVQLHRDDITERNCLRSGSWHNVSAASARWDWLLSSGHCVLELITAGDAVIGTEVKIRFPYLTCKNLRKTVPMIAIRLEARGFIVLVIANPNHLKRFIPQFFDLVLPCRFRETP
jgi:hypothetical protein